MATLFHGLFFPDSPLPLIGASGAISGVLGFYFVWFPRNRVRLWIVLFPIVQVVHAPARLVLGFYLFIDNRGLPAPGGGARARPGAADAEEVRRALAEIAAVQKFQVKARGR